MTADDLADRMGVTQSAVTRLEQSEKSGRIQLDTLQRAAEALECEVVYALVPRRSLDEMVTDRAKELAYQRLGRIEHTMALEEQAIEPTNLDDKLAVLVDHYLETSGLWHARRVAPEHSQTGLESSEPDTADDHSATLESGNGGVRGLG